MWRFIVRNTSQYLILILGVLLLNVACQNSQNKSTAPVGFEVHPDFKLELVASEPLVFDPVDLEFDEHGQAFVLEMPGYPFNDADSRIVLLRDEDGDNVFDTRTVFATNLGIASSLTPYKKGFLVASPPDLIWVADTTGDQIADVRTVLMSGFEVGNQQHNFNGLTYQLRNWIYAANGGNDGAPYFINTPNEKLELRGQDVRFRLEHQQLERIGESSGGFGLALDDWGNMFETHNLEHISQLVFEDHYLANIPAEPNHALTIISDHEENGLSRIYPIGAQETRVNHPEQSGFFSGACGITYYGGNSFPAPFNGAVFVPDVVLNLVHVDILSPQGSAFKASRAAEKVEFIASTDRAFRPVNMTTGPDGALYLLDMHRTVIEHPEWIPDEIEATLNIQEGKDQGRIYRIIPNKNWSSQPVALNRDQPEQLVQSLSHKNQWVRMTAQRLLVELGDQRVVPILTKLLKDNDNSLGQLHALWTLDGLGALTNEALYALATTTKAPELKKNALQAMEKRIQTAPALVEKALALTTDTAMTVRMQAALLLSTISDEQSLTYKQQLIPALYTVFKDKETDIWSGLAIVAAVRRFSADFLDQSLTDNLEPNDIQRNILQILAKIAGSQHDTNQVASLLNKLAANITLEAPVKALLLDAFAHGWSSNNLANNKTKQLVPLIEAIEKDENPAIVLSCTHLRQALNLPLSQAIQAQIQQGLIDVKDQKRDATDRIALLKLIEMTPFTKRAAILYNLLNSVEPLALQEEVLWQLWRSEESAVAQEVINRWSLLSPEIRKKASDLLLYRSSHHDALLTALETGKIKMGEMNFDLERRRTLLWWSDSESVKKRAEALFSDAGIVTRKEAIEKMRPALALAGNHSKGEAIFSTHCSNCHQYGSLGKNVGPVLTEINRKSKESLLYEILDPNASVDNRYINHQIKTANGNIYSGIIEQETDKAITILAMGGQNTNIPKEEINQFQSLGISLMPEGFEASLTPQEMADLLAFLQQPSR